MAETYVNGSDLLLFIDGKAIGHCTSCSIKHNTESKERAVKPLASVTGLTAGKWTEKSVTKLSESLSAEGLMFKDETEFGYYEALTAWEAATPIECKYAHRGEETTKYRGGKYVITSLEQTRPAGDDATYSIGLESVGEIKNFPAGG